MTRSKVLRPDDAVCAVADLGLADLPLPAFDLGAEAASFPSWVLRRRAEDAARREKGRPPTRPRSAKELPALHGVWCAAVEAGLIEVHGSTVTTVGAFDWTAEPVETWARLLAGLLRSRVRIAREEYAYYAPVSPLEVVYPFTAQVMEGLEGRPFPVLLPALAIATASGDVAGLYGLEGGLLHNVRLVMRDWMLGGVIEPADGVTFSADELNRVVKELADGLGQGVCSAGFLDAAPRAVVEAVYGGEVVRVSALGAYGIRRLLAAHGWIIREPQEYSLSSHTYTQASQY